MVNYLDSGLLGHDGIASGVQGLRFMKNSCTVTFENEGNTFPQNWPEPLAPRHSVTTQKTRIPNNSATKTLNC